MRFIAFSGIPEELVEPDLKTALGSCRASNCANDITCVLSGQANIGQVSISSTFYVQLLRS